MFFVVEALACAGITIVCRPQPIWAWTKWAWPIWDWPMSALPTIVRLVAVLATLLPNIKEMQ